MRPTLETKRLVLRPFALEDAKDVQRLAGHPLVAATTLAIPHPYPDGAAEEWIQKHAEWFEKNHAVQFAITLKLSGSLIGCIDLLGISSTHLNAEMGYWIGVDYWNQGYCTEAARAIVQYGFEDRKLNRIVARHIVSNPASGKVMLKVGMRKEGVLRESIFKNGKFHDVVIYSILKSDQPV